VTQEVDFTYDIFGRRISKNVVAGGSTTLTEFVYDGANVLLDFRDSDGAAGPNQPVLAEHYLDGPAVDQVFAQDAGSGNVQWLLTDHLGSTTDLINSAGSVVDHVKYDSYGNAITQSDGAKSSRYLYTGREMDNETGLYYYRARYYDAAPGKFLNEDPIGFGGGSSDLYTYVLNCPANLVDPLGLANPKATPGPLENLGHFAKDVETRIEDIFSSHAPGKSGIEGHVEQVRNQLKRIFNDIDDLGKLVDGKRLPCEKAKRLQDLLQGRDPARVLEELENVARDLVNKLFRTIGNLADDVHVTPKTVMFFEEVLERARPLGRFVGGVAADLNEFLLPLDIAQRIESYQTDPNSPYHYIHLSKP
jgi:RHS repeat-associated protein